MKILIKCHEGTYPLLYQKHYGNHVGSYWNFLHYNIWKKQGHEVMFFGEKPIKDKVTNKYEGYDILFFRGYNSFNCEKEFGLKALQEFKGKKILYIEGKDKWDRGQYFDTVFIPEFKEHQEIWLAKYPKKDIRHTAWTSSEFKLIDKIKENPYPRDNKFRIIYTGDFNAVYLNNLIQLAKLGETIILGGIYYDGKICRGLSKEEIGKLPFNIKIFNLPPKEELEKDKNMYGIFRFGSHYPYLKHADLALAFYPYPQQIGKKYGLSSKLIDYMCCGLPVVCEDGVPNKDRVKQYNAGKIVEWKNFKQLYEAIQLEKTAKRNKKRIMNTARYFHNPEKICKEILL